MLSDPDIDISAGSVRPAIFTWLEAIAVFWKLLRPPLAAFTDITTVLVSFTFISPKGILFVKRVSIGAPSTEICVTSSCEGRLSVTVTLFNGTSPVLLTDIV